MMRRMKRTTVVGVTALAVAAVAVGGTAFALADTTPTQLNPAYVARDSSGAEALSVQLQLDVRNTGSFDFSVPGVGDWVGVIPIGPVSSQISHVKGEVAAKFQGTGASTVAPATVRMEGEFDQSHNRATVNLWVTEPGSSSTTHYLIHSGESSTGDAPSIAQSALAALAAQNWSGVYQLAASAITSRYTEAQFVEMMSTQSQPAMSDATFSGDGAISVTSGLSYFTQPITFTSTGANGPVGYTADLSLISEQGTWKFAGSTTPQPAS